MRARRLPHLQHPVKAASSGNCSIGIVPNPVIRYRGIVSGPRAGCSEVGNEGTNRVYTRWIWYGARCDPRLFIG